MMPLTSWRVWLFGFLTWLIPFVVAIPFFDPSGALVIAEPLFKSLMVVIAGFAGAMLLVGIYRQIKPSPVVGLLVGGLWLIINLALDWFILLPISGDSFSEYFADIGLRYLMIPIMATAMGMVAIREH